MRIVIVESTPVLREYLARSFQEVFGHEVVGLCRNGWEAGDVIARTRPDLVLVELARKPEDGFHVAAKVANDLPGVRCLFMSAHTTDTLVSRIEEGVGAAGFIDRSQAGLDEFRSALEAVAAGQQYFSESYRQKAAQIRRAEAVVAPVSEGPVPFATPVAMPQVPASDISGTEAAPGLVRHANIIDFAKYAKTSVSTFVFNVSIGLLCGIYQVTFVAADFFDDCPV